MGNRLKVALVYPPVSYDSVGSGTNKDTDRFIPLGMASVAGKIVDSRDKGHLDFDLMVLDALSEGLGPKETLDRLLDYGPDVVGMSVLTPSANTVIRISSELRKRNGNLLVVWGGIHPSLFPRRAIEEGTADIMIRGDGESNMERILSAYSTTGDIEQTKELLSNNSGITLIRAGRIFDNGIFLGEVLDELPHPAYRLFPLDKYFWQGRKTITVESGRGCVGKCTYCESPAYYGNSLRQKSPEKFLELLKYLNSTHGFGHFYIVDDSFTVNVGRTKRIADMVAQEGLGITMECYSRADSLARNPDLAKRLREAGVEVAFIGVESGDADVLASYGKRISHDQIEGAFRACDEAGIIVKSAFMIGGPLDTEETVRRTMEYADYLKELTPHVLHLTIATPYPGTQLYSEAVEKGWLKRGFRWEELDAHGKSVMRTDNLSRDRIEGLYQEFLHRFYTPEYVATLRTGARRFEVAKGFIQGLHQ